MDFERGLEPKESIGIGVDAHLKELGCKFAHTQLGEPVFVKEEDRDILLRPLDWNSQQLRAMADYLDAHPESIKVIDITDITGDIIRGITGDRSAYYDPAKIAIWKKRYKI
jgi:hypothetical protein